MARKSLLFAIRLLVSLNLFYAAIFLKLAGAPYSVAAFTMMSNALHGLISQPAFRIGSGVFETVLALLFLIPRTARYAALIVVWMIVAILSHIFVLGYGWIFADALAIFFLSCLYLSLTRTQSGKIAGAAPVRYGLLLRFPRKSDRWSTLTTHFLSSFLRPPCGLGLETLN